MAWLALVVYAVYLRAAFLARTELHHRRTRSTGFHGISCRPGSAEWFGGVPFVLVVERYQPHVARARSRRGWLARGR